MELLNIAGIDFTNFIEVPTYKVNELPVFEDFLDAYFETHRNINRQRVSGTFSLKFVNKDDYYNFLSTVRSNTKAGGYLPATVFLNNRNITKKANFFFSMEPANTVPFFGVKEYDSFEVTIEEK